MSRGRPRGLDTRLLLAGYGGLAGFFALEAALRHEGNAAKLRDEGDDRGTTGLIIASYAIAADLPLLGRHLPSRSLPRSLGVAGLALEGAGLALRAWSMQSLGRFYSRTLRTEEDAQQLVERGPYRWVRHPGYAGSLLIWTGFSLTSRRWPVVAMTAVLLGAAYGRRIRAEEQLLRREVPGYAEYCARTTRLVPLVC